jgi:oligopeptidase B
MLNFYISDLLQISAFHLKALNLKHQNRIFMKNLVFIGFLIFISVLISCNSEKTITSPKVKKNPKELVTHGHLRIDNYYWLNDRENPEVVAYLEAENHYLNAVMKHTEPIQDKLYEEIRTKIKEADETVPYLENGYYYYTRTLEGSEYYLQCRKKGSLDAPEEILLDVNNKAEGYAYFAVGGGAVSPDNTILAYAVDTVSRRNYSIYFKNLETGKILPDIIPMSTGNVVWGNDNKTVFYVLRNETTLRSERIMKHTLGTPVSDDKEVFFEDDDTFSVSISKTKSGQYLMIGSYSTLTTEFRYLDANNPAGQFEIFQPRIRGLEYAVNHAGSYFYIRTNLDATNFRLMRTPLEKTGVENWQEVIPHRSDVFLTGFDLFKDFLVVQEKKDGLNHLRILPWQGSGEHYISFDEEVYTVGMNMNRVFDAEIFRFSYSSLTTPSSVFDYNMKSRERELLKQDEILGGFNASDYETKRDYATASDGTKIPLSIVYRKGFVKDGSRPALLYGYGSYGATMEPWFRMNILPLLDRGFVYVIAHIRGEQFYGRQWYEDGKLLKKMNTFTDFNAAAEHLINEKYTSTQKLFAKGGSAGGLLMGAAVNLRPDLYKGIIANVPFVDVVTTMLDESIPLTTSEFDEWGNPKEEEYYYYMLSYSPYDNVEAKNYPAILVTTGFHDSQVQYWEPAKWVAKLRDMKTDDNLLLFQTQMDFGHGGASGRFQWIKDLALEYAFIFDQLGISE